MGRGFAAADSRRRLSLRTLIASLALAAAVACGGSSSSGGAGSGSSTASASGTTTNAATTSGSTSGSTVVFKETEYTISPMTLTLKAGTYTFRVTNVGQFPHDLHVAAAADGTEVGGSTVITAGSTTSFTVTLKPGTYAIWCAVDAHRSLGMQGTLTVQ